MYVLQDLKTYKMSILEKIFRIFFDRGVSSVFIYRLSRWCYMRKLRILAILLKQFNIILNNCEIAYQAQIGKVFRIYHAFGIVIPDSEIGNNFTIFQNSTIGETRLSKGVPKIGDNVTLYTGSVVVGRITVGNNVIVGANTVVTKDVPDNTKVLGEKSKYIIKYNTEKRS